MWFYYKRLRLFYKSLNLSNPHVFPKYTLRAHRKKSVFLGLIANNYPLRRTLIILTYIIIT